MLETTIAIAIVVGITEVIKKASGLNSRYAPLLSLIVGIATIFIGGDLPVRDSMMTGIIVGLSASGLYGGVKKTVKG